MCINAADSQEYLGRKCRVVEFFGDRGNLNDNFSNIGYLIIGIFILSWLLSTVVYRVKKYDDIEVNNEGVTQPQRRNGEDPRR